MILREQRTCPGASQIVQWSVSVVSSSAGILFSLDDNTKNAFLSKMYTSNNNSDIGSNYTNLHVNALLQEYTKHSNGGKICLSNTFFLTYRLQGCFDALQKRYLRLILLSIYSDPEFPQKVTECYQFRIQYTEKGPRLDFESKNQKRVTKMDCNDIKKASILLVRKLYTLMQNLGPLPDSVCLNMKLSYYDEVTPEDYQPVGFKEGNNSTLVFEKEPVNLTMGEVVTPFHTLKVDVTTEKERLEQVDDDEPVYSRDKWALKINEEEIVSVQNIQQEIAFKGKVVRDTGIENSDLSKSEMLDDSQAIQVDSVVKSKTALDVATKTTRSRRAFKSMDKKSGAEVPSTNKNMFEFPTSQDLQPTPLKRRKFSVPKDSR
uniref:HORMA domain containing 1 n=1 Tax=Astyanax mexicanus TaxID=7994 RepID=A0A8B9JVF5_ASTMX